MKGFDVAANVTAVLDQITADANVFVARYHARVTQIHGKILTLAEAQAIGASGLQIVSVWENGSPTIAAYFTNTNGAYDGASALACAKRVGQPATAPIYFAVDCDLGPEAISGGVTSYFRAIGLILGKTYPIGVYGSGLVCQTLLDAGLVTYTWLAQSSGWAGHADFHRANIIQGPQQTLYGLTVDTDVAMTDDYGGWTTVLPPIPMA